LEGHDYGGFKDKQGNQVRGRKAVVSLTGIGKELYQQCRRREVIKDGRTNWNIEITNWVNKIQKRKY